MKIEEMLLGTAIGDAFGVGLEFQDRDWIKKNVDFSSFVNRRDKNYAHGYESGYYSDDTEHTIGLVEALLDPRPFSEELLLEKWKEEYEHDKKRKGFPRQGHGSIQDWYEERKTIAEVRAGQQNRSDPGNAPAMRAVPLGLLPSNLINNYAIINASATHPHPQAEAASILVARASEYMIAKEGNRNFIFDYCTQFISHPETLQYLEEIMNLPELDKLTKAGFEKLCGPQPIPHFITRKVKGLPGTSMRTAGAALYTIKHSSNTFSALKNAIYLGGDVDSIAAVCTGILAGRYGLESLPQFMIKKVEGRERLHHLSLRLDTYLKENYFKTKYG